jgi:hypothetical protein
MTPQTLLRSLAAMQSLVQKLDEAGMLRRADAAKAPAPTPPASGSMPFLQD